VIPRGTSLELRFVIADSDPIIRKLVKTIVEEQGSHVVGVAPMVIRLSRCAET